MRRLPARLLPLLLACVLLAAPALAEEPAPAEEAQAVTAEEFGAWLAEETAAIVVGAFARFLPLLAGIVLLIFYLVRRHDRKPSPSGIWPEPSAAPTRPFTSGQGILILVAAFLATWMLLVGLSVAMPDLVRTFAGQMVAGQLLMMSVGICVLAARARLGAVSAVPTFSHKALGALWAVCVAAAVVIPVSLLVALAMSLLGIENVVYPAIAKFMTGEDPALPWILAFASVVMAPIAEEGIFRGLLYPWLRGTGSGRGRILLAAVGTSAVFAGIHMHVANFLPLFALAMVLVWVFEKTNSLLTVILAHAIWNLLTVLPILVRVSL